MSSGGRENPNVAEDLLPPQFPTPRPSAQGLSSLYMQLPAFAPAGHLKATPRKGQESVMVEGRRVRQQPSGKHVTSGKLFNAPFIFSSVK